MEKYTILEQEEYTNNNSYFQYDENGNPILETEISWTTKTVNTKVEYEFENYGKIIVDIPHFNPQSEDDIELGIINRGITEQRKLSNE